MMLLKLMTLSGKFKELRSQEVCTIAEALEIVRAHALSGGYTHTQVVDDCDSLRFTARTPGGRGGRNIAYADYIEDSAPNTGPAPGADTASAAATNGGAPFSGGRKDDEQI